MNFKRTTIPLDNAFHIILFIYFGRMHIRTNRSLHNQVHLKKFPAKYRLGPTLIRKQTDHQQKEKTEINKMR
jgi:hypothetical protein